jgi:hypothetical protein
MTAIQTLGTYFVCAHGGADGIRVYLLSRHYPQQVWLIKLVAAGMILTIGIRRMLQGLTGPSM